MYSACRAAGGLLRKNSYSHYTLFSSSHVVVSETKSLSPTPTPSPLVVGGLVTWKRVGGKRIAVTESFVFDIVTRQFSYGIFRTLSQGVLYGARETVMCRAELVEQASWHERQRFAQLETFVRYSVHTM